MNWRPSATPATLKLRADALRAVREFFAERQVMEVDTPALVRHAVTDLNIHSARVSLPGHHEPLYLHTSPEYAMKRLLAAGSGDIYQISHVYRGDESSRLHNAEFTLIEWYRCGFGMRQLMREVAALVGCLLGNSGSDAFTELSYAQAFRQSVGCDPLAADESQLRSLAIAHRLDPPMAARCSRDELLDWLMGSVIGPALGADGLCFVHRYPVSQAALARVDPADPALALRFELYRHGIELANGFEELANPVEQRARFESDRNERSRRGLPVPEIDQSLLDALAAGLPPVSGVALGFDRTLMLRIGARAISEVLPFALDRA
ncbi:MAG TPA: EF-P lysine aminoacylase EpmA [Steroidobacteraceae bacterium]|nr:EF-P lysine aminoacylase EpmA [Steroidobacteraceae bacterium]